MLDRSFSKVLIPAVAMVLTLAACNKGGDPVATVAIPEKLNFDESSLKSMGTSLEDAELIKALAKKIAVGFDLGDQVLIDPSESYDDHQKREQKFSRMSPDMRTVIQNLRAQCQAPKQEKRPKMNAQPTAGSKYSMSSLQKTNGVNCPVIMSSKYNMDMVVESINSSTGETNIRVWGTGSLNSALNDANQIKVVGLSDWELMVHRIQGRLEVNSKTPKAYIEIESTLSSKILAMNSVSSPSLITGTISVRSLGLKTGTQMLIKMKLKNNGKDYLLTIYRESDLSGKPIIEKYYAGSVLLSASEMSELGDFGMNNFGNINQ